MGVKNNKVVVSIHQPGYHRYLGFFKKIAESDIFIILDSVQYVPREWQNRQRFIHNGVEKWLSVPVNSGRDLIKNKVITDNLWKVSHFNIIKEIYKKAPYWDEHNNFLSNFYSKKHLSLEKMCTEMMNYVISVLDIKTKIYLASDFESEAAYKMHKGELLSELIIELLHDKKLGHPSRTTYLSGHGAIEYMNSADEKGMVQSDYFAKHHMDIEYSDFTPKPYYQCYSVDKFIPYLSAFDALINIGSKETKKLIK